jgi:hypothetical protein
MCGMDHLNTFLGVITVMAGLYMASVWWRIWQREKPRRRWRGGQTEWTFEEGRDRVAPRFLTRRSRSSLYDDVREP